ncbi:MAG: beta-glucuronidase [Candidatus Marinimicrobia bacterium]|nr:beta-glucuronidase [Candidatus Neomarinimicrobiota bacterium]MCF7827550.1 beta-glucuronidase [Candidatus Neomarinimicrobiota bacterium]MCF7881588.1 beta-glucuronidase [Candidatus Neomarinimicrobiota bacterium]
MVLFSMLLFGTNWSNLFGQELITNIQGRETTSLDAQWHVIVDPFDTGFYSYRYTERDDGYFMNRKQQHKSELVEYNFDTSPMLDVPGDWNSQRKDLFFYEGTVWYKKSFDYSLQDGNRLFVHFGAANYDAIVYLNGKRLGRHTGGFTPFSCEITDIVKPKDNFLIVKVDNSRHRAGVPTVNTDWWNYGGLTRSVTLAEVPETYIEDYFFQLNPEDPNEVIGWVQLEGANAAQSVEFSIAKAGFSHTVQTNENGYGEFSASIDVELWSPDFPRRYGVSLHAETDTITDRMGFRTIQTQEDQILLNGEPVFLRGISIHEEAPFRGGRAFAAEDAEILLQWAKELGCNFVRLAHYPHNENMIRKAEELGMMVWGEIPVYWTILWENDSTYALADQQLREMITRDKNRASVIIWSVANETPRSEPRLEFLRNLIQTARDLDQTRLITAATELTYDGKTLRLDDPLIEYLDVIGVNEYLGWYGGKPDDIPSHHWETSYNKPLIISEFGGGALQGYHADEETRWSEEYQADVYRNQLEMVDKIPFLSGMTPWILMDFRSPRRPLPDIQDYWNRKGLLSERGNKKKAFYILQKYYRSKIQ